MAGEGQSEEVKKRVEDEITCPVCHDHFQEPKILPCCHYYCKGCIQKLALRAGINGQPFPCPECRSDTLLPQNDPNQLPTAFFVNRMKELHIRMEKAHGKVEALCEQCSGGRATAFCRHCTEFICEECVKCHQKMKVFTGHRVTNLEELRQRESNEILIKKPPPRTCIDHDEQMKIYCFDCRCLICRDCTMIDHKEHKYDFVKKAAPKTKEKLTENLGPLKEIQVSLCGASQTVKSTKCVVEAQGTSIATTIEQSFNELHEIIEQRKRELLEKAAGVTKGKLDQLTDQEKRFEMASVTVLNLVDFVEQNIENATDEELMSIHIQVLNRISEEMSKHRYSAVELEPVEKANMMMEMRCAKELKRVCQETTNLLEFSIEGTGIVKPAIYSEPAYIRLIHKSMNLTCTSIEAKLKSVRHGFITPVTIQQQHKGVYKIEYIPKHRGRHTLEITANGLPLPGSPYQVFVNPSPTRFDAPVKIIDRVKKPIDIAINSAGNIVVAEKGGNVVVLDKSGKKLRTITKSQYHFKESQLQAIAVDKDDNIYLIGSESGRISKINRILELVKMVGEDHELKQIHPQGITVSEEKVIVGSRDPPYLYIFTTNLQLDTKIDLNRAGVGDVMGIASDEHANLYICDYNNGCVHILSLKGEGELLFTFGKEQLPIPYSICISKELVYVSAWSNTVSAFTKEGKFVACFGSWGSNDGQFYLPSGLVTDCDGYLYVCDRINNRLQLF